MGITPCWRSCRILQEHGGRGARLTQTYRISPECWVHCHLCLLAGCRIPRRRKVEVVKREDGVLGEWRDPERAEEMRPGLIGVSLSRWPSLSRRNSQDGSREVVCMYQEAAGLTSTSRAVWMMQTFCECQRPMEESRMGRVCFSLASDCQSPFLLCSPLSFYVPLTPSQG